MKLPGAEQSEVEEPVIPQAGIASVAAPSDADLALSPSDLTDPRQPEPSAGGATLHWAIRLLRGEATALVLLTLITIWLALAADNITVSSAIATVVFLALCAAALAGLAEALNRGKSLARGPAIVIEMLLIPIGYYMIAGGLVWLGIPSMIVGLLGSGLLLAPSTRIALGLTR